MLHFLTILLTFLSAALCRHVPAVSGGRIVGGHDADILDYPYQVSLDYLGRMHDCGGSIVSETFIITAAHCTEGIHPSSWKIRVNTSTLESGGILVPVKAVNIHPNFGSANYSYLDFDISVMELEKPLVLGAGVQPIPLPDANETLAEGAEVATSGWGDLSQGDGSGSVQLQAVEMHSVPRKKCQEYYEVTGNKVTDRMICAGEPETGGKDSCQGDSGGPMVAGGKLFGVVSWGNGCALKGFPGIYTNVADVDIRSYIKNITGL